MDFLGSEQRDQGNPHFDENFPWTSEVKTSTQNFQKIFLDGE